MYYMLIIGGALQEYETFRTAYKCGKSQQRTLRNDGKGILPFEIWLSGKLVYRDRSGEEILFTDTDPSIRCYNCTVRAMLKDEYITKEEPGLVCMGDVADYVREYGYRKVRNAGVKTIAELFTILYQYVGWDKTLKRRLYEALWR